MGKRLPAAALAAALRPYARFSSAPAASKAPKPPTAPMDTPKNSGAGAGASSGRAEVRDVAAACGMQEDDRVPLSEMVLDCTRRWFQDALKEARAGDAAMQVLVGQMYRSGYGVNKNEHKANFGSTKEDIYFYHVVNGNTFYDYIPRHKQMMLGLEFGWRKRQDIDPQSGKLAINAQDIMLVTRTQMILRKQANNGDFRVNEITGGGVW